MVWRVGVHTYRVRDILQPGCRPKRVATSTLPLTRSGSRILKHARWSRTGNCAAAGSATRLPTRARARATIMMPGVDPPSIWRLSRMDVALLDAAEIQHPARIAAEGI